MKSRNYIYIVLVIIIIIFHEFILAMGYMIYTTSKYIVTDIIPETFNNIVYSGNNKKAYNKHIKDHYGIVADTFELKGHYSRFWYVSTPFMEKEFSIQVVKGKVLTDTFFSTLTTDVKFQHLYSEWVKKQVGIEDENVELKFAGNYDPPYIEFNKITSLSEDYREVFENTHNLYCNRCYVSNIKDLNETNSRIIANDIREKCLFKVIKITKIPNEKISGNIHLSTGAFEKNNDKNFKYRFDLHNFSSELIESDNSHIQER